MAELHLSLDERRTWGDVLIMWIPRVIAAAAFISIGVDKFSPTGLWVRVFQRLGWGDWFRYATGALQLGGALLLLVPQTAALGAGVLACTMAGAVFFQIVVFKSITAIVPAVLMVGLGAIGLAATTQSRN